MDSGSRIQAGGSLVVAWQLKHKHVLIVGGGDVASGRLLSVLSTDATVSLIAPRDRLHPAVVAYIKQFPARVSYRDRVFKESDLDDAALVLTCIDDVDTSRRIVDLCRARRIPVNAADIPTLCDFYFGSQIRQGPLQIMISTNGNGPKLANIIRRRIESSLPPNAGRAIENVGALRAKLRHRAPGTTPDVSRARMSWMSQVCETWSLDELALLDDALMDRLLASGWDKTPEHPSRTVPRFAELGGVFPADESAPKPAPSSAISSLLHRLWRDPLWRNGFVSGALVGAAASMAVIGLSMYLRRRP